MNRNAPTLRLVALCLALLLGGCSGFGRPAAEPPNDGHERFADQPDLRAGERTLLQDYQTLLEERDRDRQRIDDLRGELERAEARATAAEHDHDREHQVRVGAEAEVERLAAELRDGRAKLLAQGIELARTEQELLELRIKALEEELGETGNASAAPPPAGSGGGGR